MNEILAIGREAQNNSYIYGSIAGLAEVARRRGDHVRARTLLHEALSLGLDDADAVETVYFLTELAAVATAEGNAIEAARLWGAAEALMADTGLALPDRGDYELRVAEARREADPAEFEQAWAEGRAVAPKEALAAALVP